MLIRSPRLGSCRRNLLAPGSGGRRRRERRRRAALSLSVDATAPATPAAPALVAADDSGTAGDGITNLKQPRFTGSTEAGATVQLINAAGTVLATTTATGTGAYTLSPASALADGTYALRVQAIDAAGNASAASVSTTLTVLTTPPAAPGLPTLDPADDSGTKGDGLTNVGQPRFSGTAAAGVTVRLLNAAGTVIGTTTANGAGAFVGFADRRAG
ncbi:MAG: Ig-like domain-containing protein [Isosphaeraceae bacterium]